MAEKKTEKKEKKRPKTGEKKRARPEKEAKRAGEEKEVKKTVEKTEVTGEQPLAEIIEAKTVEEIEGATIVSKKIKEIIKEEEKEEAEWVPKTELGKKVMSGEVSSLEQVYSLNLPILEPQISDRLVPNLEEEILQIKTVQRVTDSGRRVSFFVVAVVGNRNGCVGVGRGLGPSVRPAIENAIRDAKKNVVSIRRGCGSWECGCGKPHTIPFKVFGKYGSVKAEFLPAPRGTGLVMGDKAKKVLELAGVHDAWGKTSGSTPTTLNYAEATFQALKHTRSMRLMEEQEKKTEVGI
jgi:small subunit ribosomal protein S5